MLSIYPACFFQEENGGYSVVFPDLNYLATQGDDFENAMEMAIECLAGYLHTCKMDGESVPSPSKLSDIDPNVIAKELDPEAPECESFVNMVSVDVASYAKELIVLIEVSKLMPEAEQQAIQKLVEQQS